MQSGGSHKPLRRSKRYSKISFYTSKYIKTLSNNRWRGESRKKAVVMKRSRSPITETNFWTVMYKDF